MCEDDYGNLNCAVPVLPAEKEFVGLYVTECLAGAVPHGKFCSVRCKAGYTTVKAGFPAKDGQSDTNNCDASTPTPSVTIGPITFGGQEGEAWGGQEGEAFSQCYKVSCTLPKLEQSWNVRWVGGMDKCTSGNKNVDVAGLGANNFAWSADILTFGAFEDFQQYSRRLSSDEGAQGAPRRQLPHYTDWSGRLMEIPPNAGRASFGGSCSLQCKPGYANTASGTSSFAATACGQDALGITWGEWGPPGIGGDLQCVKNTEPSVAKLEMDLKTIEEIPEGVTGQQLLNDFSYQKAKRMGIARGINLALQVVLSCSAQVVADAWVAVYRRGT